MGFFSSQKYINFSFTYFYFRIFIRSHQASMTLRSKNHSLGSWGRRQKTVALWVASKSSFFFHFSLNLESLPQRSKWDQGVRPKTESNYQMVVAKKVLLDGMLVFWNLSTVTFWLGGQFQIGEVGDYFGTYLCFERSGFSLEYFLKKKQCWYLLVFVLPSWLYSAHSQFSLEERM